MKMPGYREMFIRSCDWHGERVRPHTRMFIRLAPPERPDAVLALGTHDGQDNYVTVQDASEVRVSSDGVMFFGAGVAGMAGAMLASRIDQMLAGWDIHLSGAAGHLHLYTQWGPPPSQSELNTVEQRLQQARLYEDAGDPETEDVADALIEARQARDGVGSGREDSAHQGRDRVLQDSINGRLAGHPMPVLEYEFLYEYLSRTSAGDDARHFGEHGYEIGRTVAYVYWALMSCWYLPDEEAHDFVADLYNWLCDLRDEVDELNGR